jgi:hypothetical protein
VIVDKDSTDVLPKDDSNKGQSMPDGVSADPFPALAQPSVQSGAEWNGIQSNVATPNSLIPPIPFFPISKREGPLSKELIETVKDTKLGNSSTESVQEWPMPFRQAPPRIPEHQSSLSERERQLKDGEEALEVSLHEVRRRDVELKRWAEKLERKELQLKEREQILKADEDKLKMKLAVRQLWETAKESSSLSSQDSALSQQPEPGHFQRLVIRSTNDPDVGTSSTVTVHLPCTLQISCPECSAAISGVVDVDAHQFQRLVIRSVDDPGLGAVAASSAVIMHLPCPLQQISCPQYSASILGLADADAGAANVTLELNHDHDHDIKRVSIASTFSLRSFETIVPSIYSFSDASTHMVNSRPLNTSITAVTPTQQQQHIFRLHRIQWDSLDVEKSLTWASFPWPTFGKLTHPRGLAEEEVNMYLHFLHHFEGKSSAPMQSAKQAKEKFVVEYTRRWHPDRLEAKVLDRVVEIDKENVRVCVIEITRILRRILVYGLT